MSIPHGFIETLAELSQAGEPFVTVTLVEAIGSTPQDAGARMLVGREGRLFGTVGGGRVELKAIAQATEVLTGTRDHRPTLVEWNLQRDVGMTCGGVVKLFFESTNINDWHVVVFGAGHVAQALVRCLLSLHCRITCIDPRPDWLKQLPASTKLAPVLAEEMALEVPRIRATDYVLCMTMGHRTDRPVLEAILRSELSLPYLGVIGSQAKRKVLVRELTANGIAADRAEAFRCPIGLRLGTNEPGEIAISVAAELIQCRDAAVSR